MRTGFVNLYAIRDIAADKAHTVGRRAVWRDYVDLFFILKKGYLTVIELNRLAQKKFGVDFNPKLFLEKLLYFKDLEIVKISFIREEYPPSEIQAFLKKEARKLKNFLFSQ